MDRTNSCKAVEERQGVEPTRPTEAVDVGLKEANHKLTCGRDRPSPDSPTCATLRPQGRTAAEGEQVWTNTRRTIHPPGTSYPHRSGTVRYPAKAQTGATCPTGPEAAGARDRDSTHRNPAAPEMLEEHGGDNHREILETLEEERQRAV